MDVIPAWPARQGFSIAIIRVKLTAMVGRQVWQFLDFKRLALATFAFSQICPDIYV